MEENGDLGIVYLNGVERYVIYIGIIAVQILEQYIMTRRISCSDCARSLSCTYEHLKFFAVMIVK